MLLIGNELLRSSWTEIEVGSPTTEPLEDTVASLNGPALRYGCANMSLSLSSTQYPSPVLMLTKNDCVGGLVVSGLTSPSLTVKQYSYRAAIASARTMIYFCVCFYNTMRLTSPVLNY